MDLELFAEVEDSCWDFYINENKAVYAISKNKENKDSHFGDIRHTLHNILRFREEVTFNKKYKKEIETIMNRYANRKEVKTYKEIAKYK